MTLEASLRAQGCLLIIRIERYEFPEAPSAFDANWLVGEVEVISAPADACRVKQRLLIVADELALFRDRLRAVVDAREEHADMDLMEVSLSVSVSIRRDQDQGTLWVSLYDPRGWGCYLEDVPADRELVGRAVLELDAMVDAFPMRADTADVDQVP